MSNQHENEHENEQPTGALIPIEQEALTFRGLPLIVVRLPDSRPGLVLRWICENLGLAPAGQVARIKRTEVIADDLVYVQIQTEGGFQTMPTLVLHSVPYWLATIDTKRVKDEQKRLEILQYQREVVDVLYAWASAPKVVEAPKNLIPAEPIIRPERPTQDAPLAEWREYYLRMAALLDWQMEVENWRGNIETRVEGLEAIIPDILDRLPPVTLTPAHQRQVQVYVKQLSDLTGKHPATIYTDLYTVFAVPRYQDLPEAEWDHLEKWFRVQIDRSRARKKGKQP